MGGGQGSGACCCWVARVSASPFLFVLFPAVEFWGNDEADF